MQMPVEGTTGLGGLSLSKAQLVAHAQQAVPILAFLVCGPHTGPSC